MHPYVQIKIKIFQVFSQMSKGGQIDAGIRETQNTRVCMRTRPKI